MSGRAALGAAAGRWPSILSMCSSLRCPPPPPPPPPPPAFSPRAPRQAEAAGLEREVQLARRQIDIERKKREEMAREHER